MHPTVHYVRTADGVSLAYAATGEGPALLELPPLPFLHFSRSWGFPEERGWWERIGRGRRLVQYDPRGMGLSEREVPELSTETFLRDLDCVLDAARVERVAIIASMTSGPFAIAYAARHPERVSHLVLWCSAARLADAWPPQLEPLLGVIENDWELFTETTTRIYRGWARADDAAHRQAVFFRECVTAPVMRALIDIGRTVDTTPLLDRVRAPTLVVHCRGVPWLRSDLARELASRIPNARLTVLDGMLAPFAGDMEAAARLLDDFLGPPAPAGLATGPVTIVCTDVEGSTALLERLGDLQGREVLRGYERIVRDALRAHGGTEVKALGDGFLAAFASPARALECVVAVQRAAATHGAEGHPLRLRIGVNAGEPVPEGGDLFGTAVNLAARLAAHAEPGAILVSDVVRQLTAGRGFRFTDRGSVTLRGFAAPVHVHDLVWA